MAIENVCVFCGSSAGARPVYAAAAKELGAALAGRGLGLVYGGSHLGLMGIVADEVLARGGKVIGVIPRGMVDREIAHLGLTELLVVDSMHERKAAMADRSDAVIAMPGGFGTLDELFEMLTWAQLGIHQKPCGLLDTDGYFTHLREFLAHAVQERFVRPEHSAMLSVASSPAPLLDALAAHVAPSVKKWI
jgi:uncharacterized protein (TIGR00730 family)